MYSLFAKRDLFEREISLSLASHLHLSWDHGGIVSSNTFQRQAACRTRLAPVQQDYLSCSPTYSVFRA